MFRLITLATFSTCLAFAEEYVLDKNNFQLPANTELDSSIRMSGKGMTVKIEGAGVNMDGIATLHVFETNKTKFISPAAIDFQLNKSVNVFNLFLDGEDVQDPKPPIPLLNVPIQYRLKQGKWSAETKQDLNEKDQKELKDWLAALQRSHDHSLLGYKPRKLGESWDLNIHQLRLLLGDEDEVNEGKGTATLVSVENEGEHQLAKIKMQFETTGTDDEGVKLSLKGSVMVTQHLTYFFDTKIEGKAQMTFERTDDEITVKGLGEVTINEATTIKLPKN